MIRTVFFDLFFTLIKPMNLEENEWDLLGITEREWEKYFEEDTLYRERALGKVSSKNEIIDRFADTVPFPITQEQRNDLIAKREQKMQSTMMAVDNQILDTLSNLRHKNIRLCLISNADSFDCYSWGDSPLAKYFDTTIFSCKVGLLKPEVAIYKLAMEKMKTMPQESLYVGDGWSQELYGAHMAGMKTVFTEYLQKQPAKIKESIMKDADYHIDRFQQLITVCGSIK
jgi:putative hydrolase of the HAD superfamily